MFGVSERETHEENSLIKLITPDFNIKEEKDLKENIPDTTNIVVTKFIDSTPSNVIDIDNSLELNKKGKLIELEFLDNQQLLDTKHEQLELELTEKKKNYKRKSDNQDITEKNKFKKIKEFVKNHELVNKPREKNYTNATALCSKCGKHFSSNFNLKRHMTSCKLCPDEEKGPRYACHCGRTYSQESDMKKHKMRCDDVKKKCKPCIIATCNYVFYHKAQLVQHMKRDHNMKLGDSEVLTFNNFNDFLSWKEHEESETYTFYSKQTGSNVTGVSVNTYYVCQNDGSERAHSNIPKKTDRKNKKGRIKTGRLCWSQMNVKEFKDGTVKVTYFPNHTHPLSVSDTKHHPLPPSITNEIKRRLSLLNQQQDVKVEDEDGIKKGRKKYGVTLRALKTLARKNRNLFRITNAAVQSNDQILEEVEQDSMDPRVYGLTYSADDENADDPIEMPRLAQIEYHNQEKEKCLSKLEELKVLIECKKLQTSKIEEINNKLDELIQNYQIEDDIHNSEIMEDVQLLSSSSNEKLEEQVENIPDSTTTDVKQSLGDGNTLIYQISADNHPFLLPNGVELMNSKDFIIISTDGQYFQSVPSSLLVQQEPDLN